MPRFSTDCVHAGEALDPTHGAVNVPIIRSTTYQFPEDANGGPASHIYSRYDNPTVQAVEAKLAALEDARHCLLFASGMAAIDTVCRAWLVPGDTIAVQPSLYGGTMAYLADELAASGVVVHRLPDHGVPAPTSLPPRTKVVWMESITNPLLRVADVPAWAEATHAVGARLVVDATFATPLLQRPLALGADAVIHSASKYLGGHSDVTAGALLWNDDAASKALWTRRRNLGATLDPDAAYLLGRGMKTLALRVQRQQANAAELARRLAADARTIQVHYPGQDDHPDADQCKHLLTGGGGVVTIDLGDASAARRFRRASGLFAPAASLGGVESLVSLPIETSHAYAPAEERARDGIGPGLVRLAIGIEDVEDLWTSLDGALNAASSPTG